MPNLFLSYSRDDGLMIASTGIRASGVMSLFQGILMTIWLLERSTASSSRLGSSRPPNGGTEKVRYLIIIEKAESNYSAYSPDVPGCVATGQTREETIRNIQEALAFHLEDLREDHLPLPEPQTTAEYVTVG
jgi:predicted RNase H-like HicB family nuclease